MVFKNKKIKKIKNNRKLNLIPKEKRLVDHVSVREKHRIAKEIKSLEIQIKKFTEIYEQSIQDLGTEIYEIKLIARQFVGYFSEKAFLRFFMDQIFDKVKLGCYAKVEVLERNKDKNDFFMDLKIKIVLASYKITDTNLVLGLYDFFVNAMSRYWVRNISIKKYKKKQKKTEKSSDLLSTIYFFNSTIDALGLKKLLNRYLEIKKETNNFLHDHSKYLCNIELFNREKIEFADEINLLLLFFKKENLHLQNGSIFKCLGREIVFYLKLESLILRKKNLIFEFLENDYAMYLTNKNLAFNFDLKKNEIMKTILSVPWCLQMLPEKLDWVILLKDGVYEINTATWMKSVSFFSKYVLDEAFNTILQEDRLISLIEKISVLDSNLLGELLKNERKVIENKIEIIVPSNTGAWDYFFSLDDRFGLNNKIEIENDIIYYKVKKKEKKTDKVFFFFDSSVSLYVLLDNLNILMMQSYFNYLERKDLIKLMILISEKNKNEKFS